MKKLFKICTAILAISMITVVFSACSCGGEEQGGVIENQFGKFYKNIETVVTYKLDGQNINTKVSEDNSMTLQGILNICDEEKNLDKTPKCKFSKDFMVTYQGREFQIAQDGCNYIKNAGKYFRIPVSDRKILNDVFENNGAVIKDQEIDEKHDLFADATKATKATEKENKEN